MVGKGRSPKLGQLNKKEIRAVRLVKAVAAQGKQDSPFCKALNTVLQIIPETCTPPWKGLDWVGYLSNPERIKIASVLAGCACCPQDDLIHPTASIMNCEANCQQCWQHALKKWAQDNDG